MTLYKIINTAENKGEIRKLMIVIKNVIKTLH